VPESNKKLVLQFLELASRYDIERCLALLTEDATWWVVGDPSRLKISGSMDRSRIARVLQGMGRLLREPLDLRIKTVTAEANRVAVEAVGNSVWRSGAPFFNSYHFLFEVEAGKVATVREYMDTLQVFDMTQREAGSASAC
jgi:hypothetical protein